MDLALGVSAVSEVIRVVSELRKVEQELDKSMLKSQLAEIYANAAEAKMALSDAQVALHSKDQEIAALQRQIDELQSGEVCALCRTGRLTVTRSRPHESFAFAGVQMQTWSCGNENCSHSEDRIFDPKKVHRLA